MPPPPSQPARVWTSTSPQTVSAGCGSYRYFASPLPGLIDAIRRLTYPNVARIANRWQRLLGKDSLFPTTWEGYRRRCEAAEQTTPTPILLNYDSGGFNALHRDIRGSEFFPIQLVVVLSPMNDDSISDGFTGGEFLFCDEPERKKERPQAHRCRIRRCHPVLHEVSPCSGWWSLGTQAGEARAESNRIGNATRSGNSVSRIRLNLPSRNVSASQICAPVARRVWLVSVLNGVR